MSGLQKPDSGQILHYVKPVSFNKPIDAIQVGIGLVQQHFSLIPSFTVLENIILGQEQSRFGQIDQQQCESKIQSIMGQYELEIPLHTQVKTLPIGVQQQIEFSMNSK